MDILSVLGVLAAFGAVLGGNALEGGHLSAIMQPTAALIVFGGTLGAVLLNFPPSTAARAVKHAKRVFFPPKHDGLAVVRQVSTFAQKARREGIVSIEDDVEKLGDPFFKKALSLAVDGIGSKQIREAMEAELSTIEHEGEGPAKVFEAAGGYLPTVGILGAVLGLIHVMENISDPSKLGSGIAVAFVATVYGVGVANLIVLPIAGKLKQRLEEEVAIKSVVIEGVCAMVDGENPRLIEQKLVGYLHEHERKEAEKGGEKGGEQKAA